MIFELPKANFKRIQPLFVENLPFMAAKTVLEHIIPGKIWVDDPSHPQAACLWPFTSGGAIRLYLAGEPDDLFSHSLGRLITEEIARSAKKEDKDTFLLYFPQKTAWQQHLQGNKIFENLRAYSRSYYDFRGLRTTWKDKIPPGYSIRLIDKKHLENGDLLNLDRLLEEITSMNQSIEDWLENGFGFCAIHDAKNTIVSWITTEYMVRAECEFGIETVEEHQNKGFGTLIAAAAVEYGLANRFARMGWDTWTENEWSIRIAEKVGFEKMEDYSVFAGCFDPHLHKLINGYYALRTKKNLKEAAEIYEQAFKMGESETIHYFTAACAYAQLGEAKPALHYLEKAISKGWIDITHEDLAPLHESSSWRKITKKLAQEI